jgi:hypothetical protein
VVTQVSGLDPLPATYKALNPELLDRSLGIAAAQAIAFTATDPGASVPPWTLQRNPRRCVVDTDRPDDRPARRFDILHLGILPKKPDCSQNGEQPTRDTPRRAASAPGLPGRTAASATARPRPRAGTVAIGRQLKVLTSPPEFDGGQGLAASAPDLKALNPELLDRSLGIAAAQAIAFTATDPGASTPPWTLQRNPRRCVVDTDGPTYFRGTSSLFKPPLQSVTKVASNVSPAQMSAPASQSGCSRYTVRGIRSA